MFVCFLNTAFIKFSACFKRRGGYFHNYARGRTFFSCASGCGIRCSALLCFQGGRKVPRPQGRVARSSGRGPGEDPAADGRGRCGAARPGPLRAEGAAAAFPTPQLTAPARQGELTQLLSSSMTRLSPSCTASISTRPGVCPPLAQQERAWPCLGRRANYQSLLSPGWEWGVGWGALSRATSQSDSSLGCLRGPFATLKPT